MLAEPNSNFFLCFHFHCEILCSYPADISQHLRFSLCQFVVVSLSCSAKKQGQLNLRLKLEEGNLIVLWKMLSCCHDLRLFAF